MSLFPQAEPREQDQPRPSGKCPPISLSRVVAPRWVFGRINKKKGRHIRCVKGLPGAGVVCISYSQARRPHSPLYT